MIMTLLSVQEDTLESRMQEARKHFKHLLLLLAFKPSTKHDACVTQVASAALTHSSGRGSMSSTRPSVSVTTLAASPMP